MSNTVTLIGAETVQSAGYAMRSAAEDMNRAANLIDSSMNNFKQFMDDWLERFNQILADRFPGGAA